MNRATHLTEGDRALLDAAMGAFREQCLIFADADERLTETWRRNANLAQALRERLQEAEEVTLS